MKILLIATTALLVGVPAAAQQHDHASQPEGHARGMAMMAEHCPMMGGTAPAMLLRHADHLGLSADQVERLEAIRAEADAAARAVLTPEQRESLENKDHAAMGHAAMGHGAAGHGEAMSHGGAHAGAAGDRHAGMMDCPMMRGKHGASEANGAGANSSNAGGHDH